MPKLTPKVEIRWVDDEDPEAIAQIAQECFGTDLAAALAGVYRFMDRPDHVPKVLRVNGQVEGYLFYVLEKGLILVEEIAVRHPRRGYGRRLVKDLLLALKRLRRHVVAVRIPEDNLAAQLFFKSLGFVWFRTLRRQGKTLYAMKYTQHG